MGRYTGYMAFRPMVWSPFPVSGVPDAFASHADYERFYELFFKVNALGPIRRIWWDVRSHHHLPTIEFRVADMPMHHDDTIAIVALVQALVKTLLDRTIAGQPLPVLPTAFINENRWRAALGGLRGTLVDFAREQEMPTLDALADLFEMIAPAMQELGTDRELRYLRGMLAPAYQSGAEKQIAVYRRSGNAIDTARVLMSETLAGIDMSTALSLAPQPITDAKRRRFSLRLTGKRIKDLPAAML
jgi:glutamate---cysteine ligase / carboxylate-amine ligase